MRDGVRAIEEARSKLAARCTLAGVNISAIYSGIMADCLEFKGDISEQHKF